MAIRLGANQPFERTDARDTYWDVASSYVEAWNAVRVMSNGYLTSRRASTVITGGLDGPSRTITVEPVEVPAEQPARETPDPEPERVEPKEPVRV